jgi:hypothetical protein
MVHTLKIKHDLMAWEKETTDGVDPANTRRPFPGKVLNATLNEELPKEGFSSLGNPSLVMEDPQLLSETYSIDMDIYLRHPYDDGDLDANLLPLIFGSGDAAGDITHDPPLDTFVVEGGLVGPNPEYFTLLGCKFKTIAMTGRTRERITWRLTIVGRILIRSFAKVDCSVTDVDEVVYLAAPYVMHKDVSFEWKLKGDVYKIPTSAETLGDLAIGDVITGDAGDSSPTGTLLAKGDDYLILKDVSGTFTSGTCTNPGTYTSTYTAQGQDVTPARIREVDMVIERNTEGVPVFGQELYDDFIAEDEFEVTWTVKFVREHNIFYTIFHSDPAFVVGQVGMKMTINQSSLAAGTGFYMAMDMGYDTSGIFCDMSDLDFVRDHENGHIERGFGGKLWNGEPVIDFEA